MISPSLDGAEVCEGLEDVVGAAVVLAAVVFCVLLFVVAAVVAGVSLVPFTVITPLVYDVVYFEPSLLLCTSHLSPKPT